MCAPDTLKTAPTHLLWELQLLQPYSIYCFFVGCEINDQNKKSTSILTKLITRKHAAMFRSSLAKSTDTQTFPYTKTLSPASDIEYFLHLSPFRSEFPAHSLLYAISPMPRFGTFRNKSLTTFASGLAALERLYSSGQQQATGLTTPHNSLAEFQHATDFNKPSPPSSSQAAWHMTVIK